MRAKDNQTIVNEIHAKMQKQGGPASIWYVGITENIDQRLFGDHNVPKKDHWFIYRKAYSVADARTIEKSFLDYGCDGGMGGGDEDAVFVYAYLKTSITNP